MKVLEPIFGTNFLGESLHTFTGDDKLSNLFAPNQDSSTNSQGNVLRADAQAAFGGSPSASTLRPQQIREVNPEKISGQDIVAAISKMNISLTSGLNNVSQGINNLTVTTSLVNQNINKVSSLLGSVNTSLDRQKSVLDDISDALGRSRYEQPKTNFSGEGSGSNLGRTNIGPTLENKSPETEKNEHDLIHNVGQVIKEGFEYVIKGAGLGGGAWGFNKLFGGAKAAAGAAPIVEGALGGAGAATVAKGAAGAVATTEGILGGASTLGMIGGIGGAAFGAYGLHEGSKYIANKAMEHGLGWKEEDTEKKLNRIHSHAHEWWRGKGVDLPWWDKDEEEKTLKEERREKHHGRQSLGHHHQRSWFNEILGVAPAEAATEAGDPRQLGPSAVEKANPAVERTDKPDKPIVTQNVKLDGKGTSTNVDLNGDNVNVNINGESIARVLKETLKGAIAGGIAGTVYPEPARLEGAGVGAGYRRLYGITSRRS